MYRVLLLHLLQGRLHRIIHHRDLRSGDRITAIRTIVNRRDRRRRDHLIRGHHHRGCHHQVLHRHLLNRLTRICHQWNHRMNSWKRNQGNHLQTTLQGELDFFCLERWIWIPMNQWIIRMVACLHRLRDRQERRESDDWQGLRNHQCLFNYLRNVVLSIHHHEKVEMLDLLCLWMLR